MLKYLPYLPGCVALAAAFSISAANTAVMKGVPPSRESQVTFANYLKHPLSTWAFSNMGAPTNVVMVPREGHILDLGEPSQVDIGKRSFEDLKGNTLAFEQMFEDNYADGVVVINGGKLLYEQYFKILDQNKQHIWFSMTKSLVSTAFGLPVATGGMNTTLRDAAKFGMMIRDRGEFRGRQIIPADWVDATLRVSRRLQTNMGKNPKYGNDPWSAYHNMWWILDDTAGEYCAVGVYGQVIYINRSANVVMAWFSSQPVASAANNPDFHSKLKVARELANHIQAN